MRMSEGWSTHLDGQNCALEGATVVVVRCRAEWGFSLCPSWRIVFATVAIQHGRIMMI